jgi:hypothetical protein
MVVVADLPGRRDRRGTIEPRVKVTRLASKRVSTPCSLVASVLI